MSANASKGRILSLDEYRKQRHAQGLGPEPFDPKAFGQAINRARLGPTAEEREMAVALVLRGAEELLQAAAVMGGEIVAFRRQTEMLVQQNADLATINSVLLHEAGGRVEVDAEWFAAWDPPAGSGLNVTEDPDRKVVVIESVVLQAGDTVDSVSANEQTGGHDGAD